MKTNIEIEQKTKTLLTDEIWNNIGLDLRRFIYSKIADEDIVNDLMQEIFCKIHANIHQLQDNSKLGGWTFQIARNAIMDYFRHEKRAREFLENIEIEEYSIEDSSAEILRYCMQNFISRLPQIYRDALVFTQMEGNPQTELAKKEGISLSAAKSRVQRARKLLKEMIISFCQFESNIKKIDIANLLDNCPLHRSSN